MAETSTIEEVLASIRTDLRKAGNQSVKDSALRFFKEPVKTYGVKVPITRAIGKKYLGIVKKQPKEIVFQLCDELWKSGVIEESIIACQYSYSIRKQFIATDFNRLESWVSKYVNNWASCDTLCNHTVGEFLQAFPQYITELKKWAKSSNRWMRRASAVSLIVPASKGMFATESLKIARILLQDKDDLVQKGYGWLLKCVAKYHPELVFDFVMQNKSRMPRTALRYAIEKMSPALKKQAMS